MTDPAREPASRLPLLTKIIYGSGDWGMASYNTLRLIFYAIFLTDTVGLEPRLASFAALIGLIWDAINDPLVGMLSDRLQTRFGRRRPFLLLFSVPFGFAFLLLWWTPPWRTPAALAIHVTLAYILADTLQTLVTVPHNSLTPELTPDYDERTSLAGFRMLFNLLASLVTAVAAPMIVDGVMFAGGTSQQGYLTVAALFGTLAAIPYLLIGLVTRERTQRPPARTYTIRQTIETAWRNVPFRYATALYMLNWLTFDLVSLMLPYFLIYWVAGGNLLAQANLFGIKLALESAVLGLMLITALAALPLWTWLAQRFEKRLAYIVGMAFWGVVQFVILFIQPGQVTLILALAVLAGVGVSTAHVLPDAIFPDVLEWDELRTGERREGMYYGAKNLLRKLTNALAIFVALQVLGWFGYRTPPDGVTQFMQPASALLAIRLLTGLLGMALLAGAMFVAARYPIDRKRHARIRALLARQQQRARQRADAPTT